MNRLVAPTLLLIAFTVVLVAFIALPARAWGPASHYYFTCTASGISPADCFNDEHRDLLSGTEMPDAFGFATLLSPMTPGATLPCNDWTYFRLHSPVFAGFLYLNAANYTTDTFNATDFATGFGMHVTADAAGFYDKGYLGFGWPQHFDPAAGFVNVNKTANWLSLWPTMTAVDAHVFEKYFKPSGKHLPHHRTPSANNETAAFVAATVALARSTPEGAAAFPAANSTEVQECAGYWQAMAGEESRKVEKMPREAYGFEMVWSDRYGAKNISQAFDNFESVRPCAVEAPQIWLSAISTAGATPLGAAMETLGWIEKAYAAGKCSPPSA